MPSNPASFASFRHCSNVIFSGYGDAHKLIDFLNAYFLRGLSGAFGWAANADAPSAAADVASSSRRSGQKGPDMRETPKGEEGSRHHPRCGAMCNGLHSSHQFADRLHFGIEEVVRSAGVVLHGGRGA